MMIKTGYRKPFLISAAVGGQGIGFERRA